MRMLIVLLAVVASNLPGADDGLVVRYFDLKDRYHAGIMAMERFDIVLNVDQLLGHPGMAGGFEGIERSELESLAQLAGSFERETRLERDKAYYIVYGRRIGIHRGFVSSIAHQSAEEIAKINDVSLRKGIIESLFAYEQVSESLSGILLARKRQEIQAKVTGSERFKSAVADCDAREAALKKDPSGWSSYYGYGW